MFCSNCGKELTGTARFCPNCGTKREEASATPSMTTVTTEGEGVTTTVSQTGTPTPAEGASAADPFQTCLTQTTTAGASSGGAPKMVVRRTALAAASQSSHQVMHEHIPNPLVGSILVTIFCCLPFGIVSIVYAAQISGHISAGNYAAAKEASQNASLWMWLGLGIGVVVFLGWMFLGVALA